MKEIILFKKFLSIFLILTFILNLVLIPQVNAVSTNGLASPWTVDKAEHLAKRVLIGVNPQTVQDLYNAGSAVGAVNILFPSISGPDRTNYNLSEETFKGPTFNPSDTNSMRKLYAFRYYADPYEAKRKLFSLFEDIFPIDRTGVGVNDINFPDIENHFDNLWSETLGNYKNMVRKVLFNTSAPESSFAMGRYLDLLNQPDKNYPNENYARELMQLFLMLEYKPWEDAESTGAVRNYTESDVNALARIITGFRSGDDKKVYFDMNYHNTGSTISFLTGALKSGDSFPFYNTASGTIDNNLIVNSINGNNGLADNTIDYIFSKREVEIADFLAWRLIKFYIKDKPSKTEIETVANQIVLNNFEIYPTVKWLLSSDMMYSDEVMNSLRYKNPLELTIGTLKQLHYKNPQIVDGLLNDTSLLTNLDWTPYNPRSIFGRDGFDNNANFMNAYFHNEWTTYTSKIAFTTGTGYYDLAHIIPTTRKINEGTINVKTNTGNTFSGSINLLNISIILNQNVFPAVSSLSENTISTDISIPQINTETQTGEINQVTSTGNTIETSSGEILINKDTQTQTGEIDARTNTGEINQTIKENIETSSGTQESSIIQIQPQSTGSTSTGTIEENQTSLNTFDKLFSFVLPKANADIVNTNTITFSTGIIVMPDFYILTNSGNKINIEGTYDSLNGNLVISSGSLSYGTGNYSISSSSLTVNPGYSLERDITIDEMLTQLEDYLYLGKRLPTSLKDSIKQYLLKTDTGIDRLFLPNNTNYRNKYIKAVLSMMLVQPEFMLQSGYDLVESQATSGNTPINNANSKLVMIELYGGYDWMNGIIPKSDFAYYQNIRKDLSITGSNLIDLGDVYMNKNLEAFKKYFDSGELRIVNRVGAPNHSRGHDTAAIQVSSQKALQSVGTPGLIGELIKNETNPLNHIVLGTNRPPIYTNGKYINIGGSSIMYKNNISGTTTAEKNYQISSLRNGLNSRTFPGTSSSVFKNSITLDDVAKSGQETTGYTLSGRLNFTNNLMNNGLGITYYVGGGGGYDTHGDQLKTGTGVYNLNDRTRDLALDITGFFDKAKTSGKDVTIIVYSEFGRTLKTNGTIGTDHGEGGGYFILTTNNSLKSAIPEKVVGKLSPEKEYEDWFGVGIDYRSIYSKILSSLYNIDVSNYFFGDYKLEDDLNTTTPNPSSLRTELKNSYSNNMNIDLRFNVDDRNFIFKDGSYIKLYTGTNPNNLKEYSRWTLDNYSLQKDGSFKIGLGSLTKNTSYYYKLEIVDNQYDTYIASGSFIVPNKITNNSVVQIPLTSNSYFSKYDNTVVSGVKDITKLVLFDNPVETIISTGSTNSGSTNTGTTNTGTITYSGSLKDVSFTGGIIMTFGTGETSISQITSSSGIWNGGFILPTFINKDEFLSDNAKYNNFSYLKKDLSIDSILKVGADTLGILMKLNQKVSITVPVNKTYDDYMIITSEDGLSWTDLSNESPVFTGGKLKFTTDHFSYFAVVGLYAAIPVDPNPPTGGGSGGGSSGGSSGSSGGGGGGGGGGISTDYCPTGDYSPSYYDRICGTKVDNSEKNSQINSGLVKNREYVENLKKKLLQDRLNKKNNSQKIDKIKYNSYEILYINGYKLSNTSKELALKVINSKTINKSDKNTYITRINNYLEAKYNFDSATLKSRELKNKLIKQEILFKNILKKLSK